MEVKYEKVDTNISKLNIYIDGELWRCVKASYFEKKIGALLKGENFKNEFDKLEKKKIISVSLYLLSRKNYLKSEWFSKMKDKLFTYQLLDQVFNEHLTPYFDEEREVKRRIEGYLAAGKGKKWIQMKMHGDLFLEKGVFESFLYELCSQEAEIEKIRAIEQSRNLINSKGKEKTIAFFLRRGFSYNFIKKAFL